VLRFHATLDKHVQWLGSAETALLDFCRSSKIVDKVEEQIARHKVKTADPLQHAVTCTSSNCIFCVNTVGIAQLLILSNNQ